VSRIAALHNEEELLATAAMVCVTTGLPPFTTKLLAMAAMVCVTPGLPLSTTKRDCATIDGGHPKGRLIYYDFGMMETCVTSKSE
jgi:hypothetical protein